MKTAILLALLGPQSSVPGDSVTVHFEAWRPSVQGRMAVDKAFGVDFLDPDAPEEGRFSFRNDAGLDDPATAYRLRALIGLPGGTACFVHFERARWHGDTTLTTDEDLGAGMTLPAGTEVKSTLTYWDVYAGATHRTELRPFFGEVELAIGVYKLDLKSEASGGEVKAGTGGIGALVRPRFGWSPLDHVRLEASASVHVPAISGSFRFDACVRAVLEWKGFSLEAAYSNIWRDEKGDQNNTDRFSIGGPSLGLALHF